MPVVTANSNGNAYTRVSYFYDIDLINYERGLRRSLLGVYIKCFCVRVACYICVVSSPRRGDDPTRVSKTLTDCKMQVQAPARRAAPAVCRNPLEVPVPRNKSETASFNTVRATHRRSRGKSTLWFGITPHHGAWRLERQRVA